MRIVCVTCLAALAFVAHAEEKGSGYNDFLEDPNEIRLGVLDASATTKVRLDGSDGRIGALVDLENDLGIDERARTLYASGSFRIYQRHFFELEPVDAGRTRVRNVEYATNQLALLGFAFRRFAYEHNMRWCDAIEARFASVPE